MVKKSLCYGLVKLTQVLLLFPACDSRFGYWVAISHLELYRRENHILPHTWKYQVFFSTPGSKLGCRSANGRKIECKGSFTFHMSAGSHIP